MCLEVELSSHWKWGVLSFRTVGPDQILYETVYLGACVEVQQLQAVDHALGGEDVHQVHDLRGAQPKLGAVPRCAPPVAAVLSCQPCTHP